MKKILLFILLTSISFAQLNLNNNTVEISTNGDITANGVLLDGSSLATEILYVSPDGDGTDGKSWSAAYTTLNAALDAASTDANDLTAILLAPNATYYDINTTGDPTWSANVEIIGPHRRWAVLKNTHATATSILKLTGKASLINLAFSQNDAVDGVIMTASAFRIRKCGFNSSTCTGAVTAINIDGSAGVLLGGIIEDVRTIGNMLYTTGLYLNQVSYSDFIKFDNHSSLIGVQIVGADSDNNFFIDADFGACDTAINIDAGNSQHFFNAYFHENIINIDDEVGDHHWQDIKGEFDMDTLPDDLDGVDVAGGDADVWGTSVEVRAAATSTKPFKIVGYIFEPAVTQKHKVRFTADDGVMYFDEIFVEQRRNTGSDAGSDTDFIFNVGTQIKASVKAETGGGDIIAIWLKIQEI